MIVSLLKYCFTQKIISKTEMDYVLVALNIYDYHGIECFSIIRQLLLEIQKKKGPAKNELSGPGNISEKIILQGLSLRCRPTS